MSRQRKQLALGLLVLCLGLAGYSYTGAYFNAKKEVTNQVTFAQVNIRIDEKMLNQDGQEVPFVNQTGVVPGMELSKLVYLTNEGSADAWVRVLIEPEVEDSPELTEMLKKYVVFNTSDKWIKQGAYYYYSSPSKAGESILEPALTSVTFSKEMGNEFAQKTINIKVSAQAVQSLNNGKTVLDASGWPA